MCFVLLLSSSSPLLENGFIGYSAGLLSSNTMPDYTTGETFFTVFGVFFPAATGEAAPNISSGSNIVLNKTL